MPEAIADLSEVIKRQPDDGDGAQPPGLSPTGSRMISREAIEDYDATLEHVILTTNRPLQQRAFAYSKTGDVDKLIAQCNDAIKAKPDDGALLMRRGSAYINKENYEAAVTDFTNADFAAAERYASLPAARGGVHQAKSRGTKRSPITTRSCNSSRRTRRLTSSGGTCTASMEHVQGRQGVLRITINPCRSIRRIHPLI